MIATLSFVSSLCSLEEPEVMEIVAICVTHKSHKGPTIFDGCERRKGGSQRYGTVCTRTY